MSTIERNPAKSVDGRSLLVENSSPLVENKSFDNFRQYLVAQKKRNVKQVLLGARKYGHILQTKDASELLTVSGHVRHHAMESLTALAKYQGRYDQWKHIKERYQLKWADNDSIDVFMSMMDAKKHYSSMLDWLKQVCQTIPKRYSNILMFATLVGLRPTEACQSIVLIQKELDNYLNKDTMTLEHWKYPDLFIRNSKKAFISIVNDDMIAIAKAANGCGYTALGSYVKKRRFPFRMGYCRKIFATYLRMNGIESETIDLLQGRTPRSVFARHYYRPDFDETIRKTSRVLTNLRLEIQPQ